MMQGVLRFPFRFLSPHARERLSYFAFPKQLWMRRFLAQRLPAISTGDYVSDDTLYRVDPQRIVYSTNIPAYLESGGAPRSMRGKVTLNIWEYKGKVVGGDWDRLEIEFDGCDFFRSCEERVSAGTEWEQLPYYRHILSIIEGKSREWHDEWECRTREDIDRKFRGLDEIFADIRHNGYRGRSTVGDARRRIGLRDLEDEIAVNVGRHGDLLFNNGRHRLTFAKLAGVTTVPVKITVRHTEWEAFKREIEANARRHGGKVLTPLTHVDLCAAPSWYSGLLYEIIRRNLGEGNRTVLDLGAHWGYFCQRFEEDGFRCTAVEDTEEDLYFLHRLRRAENRDFHVLAESVLDLGEKGPLKFDAVLALGVFDRIAAGDSTLDRFRRLLGGLDANEMYFGLLHRGEPGAGSVLEGLSVDELLGFVLSSSCFSGCGQIGQDDFGQTVYKLWR